MTTLSITALVAIIVIGVLLVAELVAMTILLSGVAKLTKQVRDHIDPVVGESKQILQKVNDVADTVKADTRKVTDTVTDMTGHLARMTDNVATRVNRTTETMQSVTTATTDRLTSPSVLTAIALFAGLQAAGALRRLASWPIMMAISLFVGVPVVLRAWRSLQQGRVTETEDTTKRSPLVMRPQQVENDEAIYRRAA